MESKNNRRAPAGEQTVYMSDRRNFSSSELNYFDTIESVFEEATGTVLDKLQTFARFVPRQSLATFLARREIFRLIEDVHGHIVECGVFRGAGLFAWAQLSAILEPYNHTRRVLGFDTFSGFPGILEMDGQAEDLPYKQAGGLRAGTRDEIARSIDAFDLNRFIAQIPRVELVEGDAASSIPEFLESNPHIVIALLYLDFDLYEPTQAAIANFWPRMPKGAIIAFDELNQSQWPGETQAVLDTIGIEQLELKRFKFNPQISYAVKK